jgi:hypothetical protein
MSISREGSLTLREAILEIGKGLSDHHPEFKAYKRRKVAEGKKKKTTAAVAVAHRAHRLASAMMRNQTLFDPDRWDHSVAGGSTCNVGVGAHWLERTQGSIRNSGRD